MPIKANAIILDILGDISEPLIGSAKDKASGVMKYLWLQPYAGYAFGSGNLTRSGSATATNNFSSAVSYEGAFIGARG